MSANTTAARYARIAWTDQFNTPTVPQLRAALEATIQKMFDRIRKRMLAIDGASERLRWHGECWRWTIEFHGPGGGDPLAVIVPSPENFLLAMPTSIEFLQSLPQRRMKRFVRDGLELAQEPFDTRWSIWSPATTGLLDEVLDVIERGARFRATKKTG
jgi:hypothetical protein